MWGFAWRDWVVVPHPALSPDNFGTGDLPARNAPQDGVLALWGILAPAPWLCLILMTVALLAGVRAAWRGPNPALALLVFICNPLVIERLLQGHWSLVICIWLLPAIAHSALTQRPSLWAYLWLASITPTGCILAALTAWICQGQLRNWRTPLAALALSAPWLIPTLLNHPTSPPTDAFILRSQIHAPAGELLTALGMRGIWNTDAVAAGLPIASALLTIIILAHLRPRDVITRKLLLLAAIGIAAALIPGPWILRDSTKMLALATPLLIHGAHTITKPTMKIAAAALALAGTWGAPAQLTTLAPIDYPQSWQQLATQAHGREVLIKGPNGIVTYQQRVVVDPRSKILNTVQSGELSVDGRTIDPPTPRYQWAQQADDQHLRDAGIGVVIERDGTIRDLGPTPTPTPTLGIALTCWWILLGASSALYWRYATRRAVHPQPTSPHHS